VVYSKLKMRQLQAAQDGGSGGTFDGGLSNSMMGGGLGVQPKAQAAGQSFGHKNYDLVYGIVKGSMEEQGVDRDTVHTQVVEGG
jgi:hypothetical protein